MHNILYVDNEAAISSSKRESFTPQLHSEFAKTHYQIHHVRSFIEACDSLGLYVDKNNDDAFFGRLAVKDPSIGFNPKNHQMIIARLQNISMMSKNEAINKRVDPYHAVILNPFRYIGGAGLIRSLNAVSAKSNNPEDPRGHIQGKPIPWVVAITAGPRNFWLKDIEHYSFVHSIRQHTLPGYTIAKMDPIAPGVEVCDHEESAAQMVPVAQQLIGMPN